MSVRYQLVCLKYRPHGRRHVLVEWHPTASEAAVAEAVHQAQAQWDVILPPIPVLVDPDRPPLAAGGWNLPDKPQVWQ